MTAFERSRVVNFAPAAPAMGNTALAALAGLLLAGGALAMRRRYSVSLTE
jgi:hypothetical protein